MKLKVQVVYLLLRQSIKLSVFKETEAIDPWLFVCRETRTGREYKEGRGEERGCSWEGGENKMLETEVAGTLLFSHWPD